MPLAPTRQRGGHYDAVIAGAGIMGLAIAWQLARRSRLRIAVLEKGAAPGEGSTGASVAICRHRYSLDAMVRLAADGIGAYREWRAFTGLARPRAEFHQSGVLWLPGGGRQWAAREHQRLRALDIPTAVLDDAALAERFPAVNPCAIPPDLATGETHDCRGGGEHLLELNGGYIDPVDAAQDLLEACRSAGVDMRFNAPVTGIALRGGRVESVASGAERFATGLFINAAGPWCGRLHAMAGVELKWNLEPTRIQALYLDIPSAQIADRAAMELPATADLVNGIYFRPQNRGRQLITGSVLASDEREAVRDPDAFDRQPDADFQSRVLHLLQHRLPGLRAPGRELERNRVHGYCGLYTVNRDDSHPLLGPADAAGLDGYWLANGFSGHGFKLAPAVGSMLARRITGIAQDFDTQIPLDMFSAERAPLEGGGSVLA